MLKLSKLCVPGLFFVFGLVQSANSQTIFEDIPIPPCSLAVQNGPDLSQCKSKEGNFKKLCEADETKKSIECKKKFDEMKKNHNKELGNTKAQIKIDKPLRSAK